ncbi:CC0125/CC1285 family lipoprotein [Tardiphaga sp. P5_C10]
MTAAGKQKMRAGLIGLLCLLLAGCGTRYQEMGFTGGVAAEQITADTWRIKARGNAYTASETVQDYVLLKAAETTQAAGGTHFQLISSTDASRTGVIVTPGQSTTTFSGNQAFTTTSPASASEFIKPGQDTYIRVLRGAQPAAISAAEIIQFTGARVKRS